MICVCGCSGSTSAGLKISRIVILVETAWSTLRRYTRPQLVHVVRMDNEVVDEETQNQVGSLFFVYFACLVVGTLFIDLIDPVEITTSFGAMVSTLSNMGPHAFHAGADNFASFTARARAAAIPVVQEQTEAMRIPIDMTPLVDALYLPMAAWLKQWRTQLGRPIVVGLTGGQGSGKSTISALLRSVLRAPAALDPPLPLRGLRYNAGQPKRMTKAALMKLTQTPTSKALSKDLKKRGWSFVGPTTAYAFMQAMGLVNDHLEGCCVRAAVVSDRKRFRPPTRR